jgi:hypothetical protein
MDQVRSQRAHTFGVWKRVAISVFILFHLLATVVWMMPMSAMRGKAGPAITYMQRTGLWQHWGMFAPEPSDIPNIYLTATVTYEDGSRTEWDWPRMTRLDLVRKYQQERFRKFAEYAQLDAYHFLWPSLALYIARMNDHAGKTPVHIALYRHWALITPPPADGNLTIPSQTPWHSQRFFEMNVSPGALSR